MGPGGPVRFRPEYLPGQTDFLEAIASATGGRVIKADDDREPAEGVRGDPAGVQDAVRDHVLAARRRYARAGTRSIVKVKGRRADVKARRGYERTESSRRATARHERSQSSGHGCIGLRERRASSRTAASRLAGVRSSRTLRSHQLPQHVRQDAAVAIGDELLRRVDAGDRRELVDGRRRPPSRGRSPIPPASASRPSR